MVLSNHSSFFPKNKQFQPQLGYYPFLSILIYTDRIFISLFIPNLPTSRQEKTVLEEVFWVVVLRIIV
jgi:hypothetical protein